jgi:hypothetical protein
MKIFFSFPYCAGSLVGAMSSIKEFTNYFVKYLSTVEQSRDFSQILNFGRWEDIWGRGHTFYSEDCGVDEGEDVEEGNEDDNLIFLEMM